MYWESKSYAKYDGTETAVLHEFQGLLVTACEQLVAVPSMLWPTKVWSDRMDNLLHVGDAVCVGDDSIASGTWLQTSAFGSELMDDRCVEDDFADSFAVLKLFVGSVNDGVDVHRGDVSRHDANLAVMF